MAIQNRRGTSKDFDASKMLPGEFAVTTDGSRKAYVAFQANDVKELEFKEDIKVTAEKIKEALGYTPADQEDITELNEKLVQETGKLSNEIDEFDKVLLPIEFELLENGLSQGRVVLTANNLKHIEIECKSGDIFSICFTVYNGTTPVMCFDNKLQLVSVLVQNISGTNTCEVIIPSNAKTLVVNVDTTGIIPSIWKKRSYKHDEIHDNLLQQNLEFAFGGLSNGVFYQSMQFLYSQFFYANIGDIIILDKNYPILLWLDNYDNGKNYSSNSGWLTINGYHKITKEGWYKLRVRKFDYSNITDAEFEIFKNSIKLYSSRKFNIDNALRMGYAIIRDSFVMEVGAWDGAGLNSGNTNRVRNTDWQYFGEAFTIINNDDSVGVNLIWSDDQGATCSGQWGWKEGKINVNIPFVEGRVYKITAHIKNEETPMNLVQYHDAVICLFESDRLPVNGIDDTEKINELCSKSKFPKSWSDKILNLQKEQGTKFTFAVQTDTHFVESDSDNKVYPLKNLTHYMGLDFICNLGDIIRGYEYDSTETMQKSLTNVMNRYIENLACPMLYALGNHENSSMHTTNVDVGSGNNSLDECLLHDELYAKIIKPIKNTTEIKQNIKGFYYYKDFDDIRVIVLNTHDIDWSKLDYNGGVNVNSHKISEQQIEWLGDIALNTQKPIIIMSHVPLVSALNNNTLINGELALQKIVDFKNNGGTVIAVMCGHIHEQKHHIEDGINHISFSNGGEFAEIVMIDMVNKNISTRMIGNYAGNNDRSFTY